MSGQTLTAQEIQSALLSLPQWRLKDNALERTVPFSDFVQAFAFMTAVALHAEAIQHHPDWRNVYNRVEIRLSTHDVGGITHLDVELAHRIERIAGAPK